MRISYTDLRKYLGSSAGQQALRLRVVELHWSLVLPESGRLEPVTPGFVNMQGELVSRYNMTA